MSTARQIADQVHAFLGDACMDMAHTVDLDFWDSPVKEAIEGARKDGVVDLKGWLGDYLYNDPTTLSDFAGDKIADLCGGDDALKAEVIAELKKALPALVGTSL